MEISGIYKIQSIVKPERIYIGSTINLKKRKNDHFIDLRNNKHRNNRLQNHFNKYGELDLQFSILLGCEKEELIKHEQFFIDSYKPFFNICPIAGNHLGLKYSEESKQNMSKSRKGRVAWNKGKIGSQIAWNKGKHYSNEKMIGNKNALGYKHTEETKRRMRKPHKPTSEKTKNILREISFHNGSKPPSRKGIKHTEEIKKIISECSKKMWTERKLKKVA